MSISLLFGKRKAAKIGELQLDATIQEAHEYDNEIAEYPIEDGSTLNDNIRLMPEKLNISGFITNSPININQENKAEVVEKFDGTVEVKNLKRDGVNNNVEFAQDTLLRIMGRKINGEDVEPELVDVITGLRVYTSMAIANLRIPRDATTGLAMRFECALVKVRKVNTETIILPNPQPEVEDRTASTVDRSSQTPAQVKARQQAKAAEASALFKLAVK